MKLVKKIVEIARHRNGIAGSPFWVVRFEDTDGDLMLATLFDKPGSIAVLNIDTLNKHGVAFGVNSFRGDWYETELRKAIKEYEDAE